MSGIAFSLARKAAAKAYGAAGKQLGLLDDALWSGQATPREVARQGNILANRRSTISGNARNTNMREKLAKRKVAAASKAPKRYGPNTRSEQYVDDLFGV